MNMLNNQPMDRLIQPFQRFASREASGGILLLICALTALIWSNINLHSYEKIWETHLIVGVQGFMLDKSLHFWVNDALMAIFFFVVGLEIKHSLIAGELASIKQASLPVMAAIGGMLVPAGIYIAMNFGTEGVRGWGIPIATDIAFSLGILALLGSRAPISLKIFLTACAIVDDIGAVFIIALFYTDTIAWIYVGLGGGILVALTLLNILGVRNIYIFIGLGIIVWISFMQSGIHSTVAGVALAATIPLNVRLVRLDLQQFVIKVKNQFKERGDTEPRVSTTPHQNEKSERVSKNIAHSLQRLEHSIHPWVAFGIMPLFALANAGVVIDAGLIQNIFEPVAFGIILGLVVGKPLGSFLFTWLSIRLGIGRMPEDIGWFHILGVSLLAGVGFTMSLFIADLAFVSVEYSSQAKIAILMGSLIAGLSGYFLLKLFSSNIDRS